MSDKLKLGFDNYAIRALDWKAPRLIEYAASLNLDTILLSDTDVYGSHAEGYLKEIKAQADALGIEIQVGMLRICSGSKLFDSRRGTAEEQLKLTIGIRDALVWETEEGAMLQWTAMGEGTVDWKRYFARFAELCPDAPVQLEIISGRPIPIPFLRDEFWEADPKARLREFMKFAALAKRGSPKQPFTVPPGADAKVTEQEFQKAELERSVEYCKEVLGLG